MSARIETESLTPLHWVALGLAAVSGAVHLAIGVPTDVPFMLAGLGFFGAIVLFLLDYRRRLLYAVGVPFTLLQVVLYIRINQLGGDPAVSPVEAIDKAAQLLLIALLVVLYRRES